MKWMVLPFKRYADFSGRSRRLEFWMYSLLNVIVIFGMLTIGALSSGSPDRSSAGSGDIDFLIVLFIIWSLATIVPNIAVTVRRLHDQDKSGWLFLTLLIPYIGWVFLLIFACVAGTNGPNQYGDDPRVGSTADVFA